MKISSVVIRCGVQLRRVCFFLLFGGGGQGKVYGLITVNLSSKED